MTTPKVKPEDIIVNLWSSEPYTGMLAGMPKGVQIVHLPTGIVIQCDQERNMYKNRERALQALRDRLNQTEN